MKTIITTFILLVTTTILSQNFKGKATYKTSKKSIFSIKNDKNGMDEKMQEQIRQRLQKMNQKTFVLNFDKTTSTFKEEEKLDSPNLGLGGAGVLVMNLGGKGSGSIYFKNIQEKKYTHKTDIQGKVFLVKDKLPIYRWKLTSETKNIGKYTCYKATYTNEVENKKMKVVDGEIKEEKVIETEKVIAWYTPQIPVSNGPDKYHGLPGLILEINDGKTVMVCTEIAINPSKKIKITEPSKGKEVNGKKFTEIQRKKSKEMMERLKTGIELENGAKIKLTN